ncbi:MULTISPECIES: hypothetical protein [Lysinibacillus]|uniref:Uncharacterized protein n=2 Tax=Lysinibacillus TaxID=400634 RepID=A0A4U2Z0N1_9BACI|nr:hypothetical protein FC748_00065 [Lysinibacillus tabacifolii]TKI67000.1 hypothetical protein FC756_13825 [Lysinibacillus mangiferihumi]
MPVTQTILKQLYKVYVPVTQTIFRLLLLKLYFFD